MATIRELKYFAGLDVGPANQCTALAILERGQNTHDDLPDRASRSYGVRHLERWPLGTPYTDIRDRLAELLAQPPLRHTQLVVDVTAVGRPVLDLLRRGQIAASIKPLTITTGHRASHEDGGWLVPKKELVSVLQVLLQARRLKFASGLTEAETLLQELATFKAKPLTPMATRCLTGGNGRRTIGSSRSLWPPGSANACGSSGCRCRRCWTRGWRNCRSGDLLSRFLQGEFTEPSRPARVMTKMHRRPLRQLGSGGRQVIAHLERASWPVRLTFRSPVLAQKSGLAGSA